MKYFADAADTYSKFSFCMCLKLIEMFKHFSKICANFAWFGYNNKQYLTLMVKLNTIIQIIPKDIKLYKSYLELIKL